MTSYNAGSINGVEIVKTISGVEVESIKEISEVNVEHIPLHTVIFYAQEISGADTKTTELSSMPGWYVCNGRTPTDYGGLSTPPDLIGALDSQPKFIRGSSTFGSEGGNDIRPVFKHTHTTSIAGAHTGHSCSESGSHYHTTNYALWEYAAGGGANAGYDMKTGTVSYDSKSHTHTSQSAAGAHSNHNVPKSGTQNADNRPAFKTLIPIIRLRRANFNFDVGCVLWYDENDISNPDTRTEDLSSYGLKGWYVCNGNSGSLNLLDRFIRCTSETPGTEGGDNDAVNAEHDHPVSSSGNHTHTHDSKSHSHNHPGTCWYEGTGKGYSWSGGSMAKQYVYAYSGGSSHSHTLSAYTNTHNHICNDYQGSEDGTNKNIPKYYSMLLIQKVS